MNVTSDHAKQLALELIQCKEEIEKIKAREDNIRSTLREILPIGSWTEVSSKESEKDYIVENLSFFEKPRLNTRKTLWFLAKRYGRDAAALVAEQCSFRARKRNTIYVRPFPRISDGELEE